MFRKRTLRRTAKKIFLLVLSLALLSGLVVTPATWSTANSPHQEAYAEGSEESSSSEYFEQWIKVNKLWFGIHAESGVFDSASKFHVEVIDKGTDADSYTNKLNMLDSDLKEKVEEQSVILFNMGVTSPDGTEYSSLNGTADIYVEQPSGWDYREMQAVLLSQYQDAQFTESFVQIDPVKDDTQLNYDDNTEIDVTPNDAGNLNFIKFTVSHFSPFAVYDELTPWDYAENYAWIGGLVVLAIGAGILIYIRARRKQRVES